MERRQFLRGSVAAAGSLSLGPGATTVPAPDKIGRPVRAVSIGFKLGLPLERIAGLVDQEGALGSDIIILPETCRGQKDETQETLDGPTIQALARLARKHQTYLVCGIDRIDGSRRFNSAVLLDRRGEVACVYNKIYPVWQDECLKHHPVAPGEAVAVHATDFGRVGMAICFDVNWAHIWQQMANLGAELVIWPSAYSAGRSLQAHAVNYNYYIMSATRVPDCLVFDIDGEQLLHEHNNRGDNTNVTRVTLDLDRCIFHQDLNRPAKVAKLLKEHPEDLVQEKWLPMEGWFAVKAKRPGVSARELARQYGLEELRHYINRSRSEIDKCRGWSFS